MHSFSPSDLLLSNHDTHASSKIVFRDLSSSLTASSIPPLAFKVCFFSELLFVFPPDPVYQSGPPGRERCPPKFFSPCLFWSFPIRVSCFSFSFNVFPIFSFTSSVQPFAATSSERRWGSIYLYDDFFLDVEFCNSLKTLHYVRLLRCPMSLRPNFISSFSSDTRFPTQIEGPAVVRPLVPCVLPYVFNFSALPPRFLLSSFWSQWAFPSSIPVTKSSLPMS